MLGLPCLTRRERARFRRLVEDLAAAVDAERRLKAGSRATGAPNTTVHDAVDRIRHALDLLATGQDAAAGVIVVHQGQYAAREGAPEAPLTLHARALASVARAFLPGSVPPIAAPPPPPPQTPPLHEYMPLAGDYPLAMEMLQRREIAEAVKAYRDATGKPLTGAYAAVAAAAERARLSMNPNH